MKPKIQSLAASLCAFLLTGTVWSQYYYQDILSSQQVTEKWKMYKKDRVQSVNILSFESNREPTAGFICNQQVSTDYARVTTYTKSDYTRETWLFAYYSPSGLLQRLVDTSRNYQSTTQYQTDASGHIVLISDTSVETLSNVKNTEQHVWQYGVDGLPNSMFQVRNGNDTTRFRFEKDEKGNIVEEHATHDHHELAVVYYYYDVQGRLTDIVRYNERAKRLLPDYMFTYNDKEQLSSMVFVPPGTSDYNNWSYEYNDSGLRISETCYDKQKRMLGRIEYEYAFR